MTQANQVHISSLVIQSKAQNMPTILKSIENTANTEVPMSSPEGKIVVVLETASRGEVTDRIEEFRKLPGVLNVVMVYHHMEDAAEMNEKIEV